MNYSLSYTLGNNGGGADPSATRYIAAVRASGATVNSNQVGEINTFYKAAKTGGYYTSLKRLYLPIWGVAAANAIDMITLASGTFVGGVTHAAGYVQGDGTTGWFDTVATVASIGVSNASAHIMALHLDVATGNDVSGSGTGNDGLVVGDLAGFYYGLCPSGSSQFYSAITGAIGIGLMSTTSTSARAAYRRNTAGFTTIGSNTILDASALLNSSVGYMAQNVGGSALNFVDGRMGLYGHGLGITQTQATSYTLALKTLWETCTGLTLP